jgi:nucleotide-binding universal stress UspA family protein
MIDKILVGTAAGESGGSLKMAAELATSNDAELVVLELEPIIDARQVFDPAGAPRRPDRAHQLALEYPGLRIRTSEVRSLPLHALCDVAEDEQADLIVVAQGGGRRSGALLSRRASTALVERAPCAVLVVAA